MKKLNDLTDSEFRDWIADRLMDLFGFTDNQIDAIEMLYFSARSTQAVADGKLKTDEYEDYEPLSEFWECLCGCTNTYEEYAEEYYEIMGEEMED